ncbi:sensor histidine kinase [Prevotella sp. 10(H)]|uniref:sensor histidine kinase n=1 Tax=Prevotella sp. 10(H) TaxID=1158294 RepID=UPI0004A6B207|nr:histidine kinase [Prevotella sp. 10(H)]
MGSRFSISNVASFLFDDKYRIWRHVVLQFVILMITIGNFFDAPDKLNLSWNRFYGWLGFYMLMNVMVYFNAYVLYPRLLAKNKIFLYIIAVIVFTLFSMFIMMILQEYFYDIAVIHHEPSAIAIFLSIASSLLVFLLFLGGISALLLFKHWMISSRRINDLRSATSQSELSFLKSQINPHFLFNMLNNANILVEEDPDMASFILVKLDDLLRYQLNDSVQDKVFLKADIEFLTNFLELEKIRKDSFEYEIDIKGDISIIQVPPLLFIPFVENAVKHNSDTIGIPYVSLSFNIQENILTFTCENSATKTPLTNKKKIGGLGLTNIKRRLDLLFENNYSLQQNLTDNKYSVILQLTL